MHECDQICAEKPRCGTQCMHELVAPGCQPQPIRITKAPSAARCAAVKNLVAQGSGHYGSQLHCMGALRLGRGRLGRGLLGRGRWSNFFGSNFKWIRECRC